MTGRTSLTIVLAAGEGTRMRSSSPKVLHQVANQSLLAHVLMAAPQGPGSALAVVVGPDREDVAAEATRIRADAATFVSANDSVRPMRCWPQRMRSPRGPTIC